MAKTISKSGPSQKQVGIIYERMRKAFFGNRHGQLGKTNNPRPKRPETVYRAIMKVQDIIIYILHGYDLTTQEMGVALLMCWGLKNIHIAKILQIEESTVRYHTHKILQKTHSKTRGDFCIMVLYRELLDTQKQSHKPAQKNNAPEKLSS